MQAHFSPARQGINSRHNGRACTAWRNRLLRFATLDRWIAAESQIMLITGPSQFVISDDSSLSHRSLPAVAAIARGSQLAPLFTNLRLSLRMHAVHFFAPFIANAIFATYICSMSLFAFALEFCFVCLSSATQVAGRRDRSTFTLHAYNENSDGMV